MDIGEYAQSLIRNTLIEPSYSGSSCRLKRMISAFKNQLPFTVLCIATGVLILDTSMNRVYYQSIAQWVQSTNIAIFILIGVISLICQFTLIRFVGIKIKSAIRAKTLRIGLLNKSMILGQGSVIAVFSAVIIQMVLEQRYNTFLLITLIGISALSSIATMLLLAAKFFSWFKRDHNSAVLLYGVSAAIIASNIAFGSYLVLKYLEGEPSVTGPGKGLLFPYIERDLLTDISFTGYQGSLIVGFIVAWISTVLLLKQYRIRWLGKFHWLIVIAPLIYFIFSSQAFFTRILVPLIIDEPAFYASMYVLLITYSKPIGGLIFGAAFWAITKNLRRKSIMMDYTVLSGYGFVLLFIANNLLILSSAPYPPYGLATVSFLGLSCFLVLFGIYLSVISISHDTTLRRSIKILIEKKSNLLGSIGVSEMTISLEKEAQQIYNALSDKMQDESGVPPVLSASEAREYCNEVINEIARLKDSTNK